MRACRYRLGWTKIQNKWYKTIGVVIGLLVFGYLAVEVYHSLMKIDIKSFLLNIRYGLLFLSILVLAFQVFCSAALWSLIVKNFDSSVTYRDCLTAYNLSLLAKYLPGGIWNHVGRVVYLQKKGVSLVTTSSSIIFEALFLVASSVTIGGVLLFKSNSIPTWVIVFTYICMILFLFWPNTVNVIINKILVLFKRKPLSYRLSRKNVLLIYLLFILSWGIYSFAFLLLVNAMNLEYSQGFLQLAAILTSSWVVGYLSPTPGGIGVREGLMTFLFSRTSLASFSGLISVISRVWSICAEVLVICLYLLFTGIQNYSNRR